MADDAPPDLPGRDDGETVVLTRRRRAARSAAPAAEPAAPAAEPAAPAAEPAARPGGPRRQRRKRPRALWREPVLIAAVLVVVGGAVAVGVLGLDELNEPVLHSPTDADGVPTALPNGDALPDVPAAVQEAFDRPVVVVGHVEDPLRHLQRCRGLVEWAYAPTLRASVVTPEGLTVVVRGEEFGSDALFQVTCYAVWAGRSWQTWASWVAETPDTEQPVGQVEPACCRDDGLALFGGEVDAPEGAAWAVQDRGAYWLAFPVDASGLVHPVWPVTGDDPAPPPVVYLDASGNRVAEEPGEEPVEEPEAP